MNQFARDDFDRLIFDNVDITELYNWRIMTTDEDKEFRFGLDRDISYEEGVFGEQLYTGTTHKPLSFDITFVKAKVIEGGVYVPQTINDKDLSQLGSLIFKGEPKALRFKNRLYYGMFKSGTGWKTTGNKGYVTVEFEMSEGFCRSFPIEEEYEFQGLLELCLINDTDIPYSTTYLDLDIKPKRSDTKFTIRNATTGKNMSVTARTLNLLKVYGQERQIIDTMNFDNIYYSSDYVNLAVGSNDIIMESTQPVIVKIKYQKKYMLK